jgi:hypothetical protein
LTLNKKLAGAFGGLVAIGATVALTAGTFSYFSDSAIVPGGEVTFGTLDLSLQGGAAEEFTIANAKPGATVYRGTDNPKEDKALCFTNAGTLDGVLRLQFLPNAGNTAALEKAVLIEIGGFSTYPASDPVLKGKNTLESNISKSAGGVNASPVYAGQTKCVSMTVSIDAAAGNAVQGATGGFTIQADLVQHAGGNDIYPASPAPAFPAAPATPVAP